MHHECYYNYHRLRYGVDLDNRYAVKKSRAKQGTKAWVLNSSEDEVSSNGSQENKVAGSWEATEEEEEANKKDEEEAGKSDGGSAI